MSIRWQPILNQFLAVVKLINPFSAVLTSTAHALLFVHNELC